MPGFASRLLFGWHALYCRLVRDWRRFDHRTAASWLRSFLGEEGYQKYLKTASESVASTETIINRFLPELSNPPEEIVAVAPSFWRPKPAEPKPKPAEAKPKPPTGEGGTGASKKQ